VKIILQINLIKGEKCDFEEVWNCLEILDRKQLHKEEASYLNLYIDNLSDMTVDDSMRIKFIKR
jgi:hypothetical protein